MVEVTERAKDELQGILNANTSDPEMRLRLVSSQEGGLSLMLDGERTGDQIVAHGEQNILLVDSDVATMVGEVTLDCLDAEEGKRLVLVPQDMTAEEG